MGTTYTTLKADIKSYIEDDGTEFDSALNRIIENAETRIYREADLNVFRKTSTASTGAGTKFIAKPTDFVIDRFMTIDNAGTEVPLLTKSVSYINEYWPADATTGLPRFYAEWDHDTFLLAPTPDAVYTLTLGFTFRPASLVTTGTTTWISDNAADVLLYACLVEAYAFKKAVDEPDIQFWQNEYNRALASLKYEEEKRQRREEYRYGEIR